MIDFPTELQQNLFIPGPAGALEILTSYPEREIPKGVAIVCHPHPLYEGSMHNKVVYTLCHAYQSLGLATVRFNFRGVGKSEGQYGEARGEQEDLRAVIHWVETTLPGIPICLAGFSFGSFIALSVAQIFPVAHLILVAPPVVNFDFKDLHLPKCPVIIAQGDQDEVVDPEKVFAWLRTFEPLPEVIIMDEAGHFFHGRLVELREKLEASLRLTLHKE